ncbi:uncharacterized protein LOC128740037 [Sabethes cyaneus]|uniref:uncharacterized protein LOC128740037 n=1 Tax=Sabethes cyaneus TaxID=53552 RepID=UPI00237DC331|nr:uncharacterized protein LOC128740037 [Sabethes cyaneus]
MGKLPSYANANQPWTKRRIYSEIAKLFDPLGLHSPSIVLAKLLVQQLWRSKLDWDDPIDEQTILQWSELRQSFHLAKQSPISRQVTFHTAVYYELHGFADASNLAYGACLYIRSIFPDNRAASRLLTSKSKVTPLHDLSIPRKELCAAWLLVILVDRVISTISIAFRRITLWSDSQIVLAWLRKHPCQLEVFVRNRTAQIKQLTHGYEWSYVRSQLNPADIVSRGQLPFTLSKNKMWWDGPQFLNEPIITMEACEEIPDSELPELKPAIISTSVIIEQQLPVFEKFSSFRMLQRVIAWVLRYINNSRKQKSDRVLDRRLTTNELHQSLLVIVRVIQHTELRDEIRRLQSNLPCMQIRSLNPIFTDNILRVGGRLTNAHLPDESKHQLILPHASAVTKLLIRTMHIEQLHVGPAGLLAAMRQRFWLTNARLTIRNVTGSCVQCFKTKPSNQMQLMGELPKQRVFPSPPFTITGVDYAGPIIVKQGSYRPKTIKAYIAVFVCLSTKAVHLELVSDLTTDAFIAALHRFVSRRGIPSEMHSDNATNFHGAKNELHRLYELFRQESEVDRIVQFCQTKEITWHFIPPDAPEFGGLWEAAVKSTKMHLKRVIGNAVLPFEEFTTTLCEIEAILNSRPLFAISNDPADPEAITSAL